MIKTVAVLGLGKVGTLVATLLSEADFDVVGLDRATVKNVPFSVKKIDVGKKSLLKSALKKADAVVSCLPYYLNKPVAQIAYDLGIHYFDLTEDVETTDFIRKLAKNSKGVMVPQCGLAPGFIGIVGATLASKFERIRSIELRVGALPQSPKGDLGYAFNWSPEGVVNEYLNDCHVIRNGQPQTVPAMQDLETIVIGGTTLEAFTTSGGLGTMCETYHGKVQDLNYKTMRYPGHMRLMRFFFHELLMKQHQQDAGSILVNAKPPVNDDVVYVHASVEGWKSTRKIGAEHLCRDEFVKAYYPQMISGTEWRAISWTTASSIVAVVEMISQGRLKKKGFVKQEDIPLEDFLATTHGRLFETE